MVFSRLPEETAADLAKAKTIVGRWRMDYHQTRLHSTLDCPFSVRCDVDSFDYTESLEHTQETWT